MRAAIVIDARSATPIHRQVYEAWREGILAGRFRGRSRVPSTRELAASLGVARSTVTQAYEQLIAEGYLQSAQGSGTFVCEQLPDELLRAPATPKTSAAEPARIRLSSLGERLTEDFLYPPRPAGFICFSHWGPDLDEFPFPLWRKLITRHLRRPARELFDYAGEPAGYRPLREQIAAHAARFRAVRCTPEQVIVVNGSQQALDLCARLLLEPGDEVAFENPGYLGTRRILDACGARLRPVGIDAEGIVLAELGAKARLAYVTPSHQFPTGVAMSLSRRLGLIEWARRQRAVIIEDDYDSEYRYSGPPLPSLQSLANDVPVIYCGSFSKVMFPGLRIGFMVVPEQLVAPLRRAKWLADRNTPSLEQAALADFLSEGHLERHVRRMRRIYGKRRQALVEALDRHFGDRVTVSGDASGMHLFARFDDDSLAERAARSKVQLAKADVYYLTKPPRNAFVLGFSTLGERAIREGVKRLAP
jgi:GntR family transcriptional regulator / MocR family aminotransferase